LLFVSRCDRLRELEGNVPGSTIALWNGVEMVIGVNVNLSTLVFSGAAVRCICTAKLSESELLNVMMSIMVKLVFEWDL
jgi:hypothetical protein